MKRAMDIVVSIVLLVCTLPITAAIAILIRTTGRPTFHRGERIGRDGVPFQILKFRTMIPTAAEVGPDSTPGDDPRITPFGRYLRRVKLDEWPQLLNVVRGEMSLVGPRPQVRRDVIRYTPEEQLLLTVRPGMTDYASIRYSNEAEILEGAIDVNEAYDRLIRPGKIALGLHYVRTRSLAVDIKILSLTMISMVDRRRALRALPNVENLPAGAV